MPNAPPKPMPTSLAEKLAQDQKDLAKWLAVAANPNLSREAAIAAQEAARSSRAAVRLSQKALNYQAERPEGQEDPISGDPYVDVLLGLRDPPRLRQATHER